MAAKTDQAPRHTFCGCEIDGERWSKIIDILENRVIWWIWRFDSRRLKRNSYHRSKNHGSVKRLVSGRGVVCVHASHFLLHHEWICIWLQPRKNLQLFWNCSTSADTDKIHICFNQISNIIVLFELSINTAYCACMHVYVISYLDQTRKSIFWTNSLPLLHLTMPNHAQTNCPYHPGPPRARGLKPRQ